MSALAGQVLVYATLNKADEETGIGWRVRGLSPTYDMLASRVRSGQQMFKLPANIGSTALNVVVVTAPLPWLIGSTPPDAVHPSIAVFIDMQSPMDALGGHAYAQPRCRVVNRLPRVEADGVRATAQSHRWLGHAMAERCLAARSQSVAMRKSR